MAENDRDLNGEPAVIPGEDAVTGVPAGTDVGDTADDGQDVHVVQQSLPDILGQSYLNYAMSVIVARALPDVRDGLKPVHRRILYAMHEEGLTFNTAYKKCATSVGDVLGRYHPHGDSSVYDAMVRLAQDFSMRYPLIDGHGNFGSMDGDPPAAYRYCLTGDALVATDSGLRRIGGLAGQTEEHSDNPIDIEVKSMRHAVNHAGVLFNSGLQSVYSVELYGGFRICGTDNHPVLTLSDDFSLTWKTIGELREGDKCVVDLDTKNAMFGTNNDLAEARMLGCMISEGYVTTQDRMGINNTDLDMVRPVKEFFESRYGVRADIRKDPRGWYGYCVSSREHQPEFVRRYGFGVSGTQCVPEQVFRGTKEYVREFLRYLYEGDGSVAYVNDIFNKDVVRNISYTSKSRTLVADIQSVLAMQFGILSLIRHDRKRDIYTLVIASMSFGRFRDEVGFVSSRKRDLLDRLVDGFSPSQTVHNSPDSVPELADYVRRCNVSIRRAILSRRDLELTRDYISDEQFAYAADLLDSYAFLRVTGIESAGNSVVYSVKVDSGCHSFSANGFINHNTESRLDRISNEMLRDIDKDTIDWDDNFDGTRKEPSVLPSRFPNVLANGSQGIAVGMACNIPPHNLKELIDGCVMMLDRDAAGEQTTVDDLLTVIHGPDFPTGAVMLGNSWREIYYTGKGRADLESVYHTEQDKKSKKTLLVFTELPYQVNKAGDAKSSLINEIVRYVRSARLDVSDVRDESSREGVRLVVELKRQAVPELVLNNLLEHTKLRSSFSAQMLMLVDGRPKLLSLDKILRYYLDYQTEIVRRRTGFEKAKAEKRQHILEGLLMAVDHIDRIIDIIRTTDDAGERLASEFGFSEAQVQAILDLRLRSLQRLEGEKLAEELREKTAEIDRCSRLLQDPKALAGQLRSELSAIGEKYGDGRRTGHKADVRDFTVEDLIQDEPCVLMRTGMGYVKRMKPDVFRLQKKGGMGSKVATASSDQVVDVLSASTRSKVFFFTNLGRVYALRAYNIPDTAKTARGVALAGLLPKIMPGEEVTGMAVMDSQSADGRYLMLATRKGVIKRVALSSLPENIRSNGIAIIKLDEGDSVRGTILVNEDDHVLLVTRESFCGSYTVDLVRSSGRVARGVKAMRLADGDEVAAVVRRQAGTDTIIVTESGYAKKIVSEDMPVYKSRNVSGVRCVKAADRPKTGGVACVLPIDSDADTDGLDLVMTCDSGQVIRIPLSGVPTYGRKARGGRMIRLGDESVKIISAVLTARPDAVEDESEPEGADAGAVSCPDSAEGGSETGADGADQVSEASEDE